MLLILMGCVLHSLLQLNEVKHMQQINKISKYVINNGGEISGKKNTGQ